MRLMLALLLTIFGAGSLTAEETTFYRKETDKFWTVSGGAITDTGQATCYGRATKKDGSFIQIHRSLVDGELWVLVHDTAWEIDTQKRGVLHWNFFGTNNGFLIDGSEFEYLVKDKNTILILQIMSKRFSSTLWNSRYFTLVMPENLQNFSASFEGKGGTMLTAMAECIKQNEQKYKNAKPPIEKIPDSVKEQI